MSKKARLASDLEKIYFTSSSYGLDSKEISNLVSKIQEFDKDFENANSEKIRLSANADNLKDDINELYFQKIPDEERVLQKSKNKIEEIKQKQVKLPLRVMN